MIDVLTIGFEPHEGAQVFEIEVVAPADVITALQWWLVVQGILPV